LLLSPAVPLRNERVVGSKTIVQEEFFKICIRLTELQRKHFINILGLIRIGGDLGPYYRKGIGLNRDDLLMNHGVMHLHLGGSSSDALLYLLQYESYVVLLRIDNHSYVDERPVGNSLPILDIRRAGRLVAEKRADEATQGKAIHEEARASLEKLRCASQKRRLSLTESQNAAFCDGGEWCRMMWYKDTIRCSAYGG